MKTRTMTRTQAELLLAAVIIARSTSYVLTKVGLQDMGKFTLLAVRFLLAFAFLAALFRRLEDLKSMEAQGVEIRTCGTCLDFYKLKETLAVGSITNMYAIAETLAAAGKVIKP